MAKSRPTHLLSSYYAPRGAHRMQDMGQQLAQMYLNPNDKLIGIIGEAGSGKSALIRGMFPGLELTNDDNGVYIRPLPILQQDQPFAFFSPHTYHLDIRFENGFTQMTELAAAISKALDSGRRVVVEHFDLVYPFLGANANLLIGVGEQVLVARPRVFGPEPDEIKEAVYESLPYRLMAHTAEDICGMFISDEDNKRCGHSDLRRRPRAVSQCKIFLGVRERTHHKKYMAECILHRVCLLRVHARGLRDLRMEGGPPQTFHGPRLHHHSRLPLPEGRDAHPASQG